MSIADLYQAGGQKQNHAHLENLVAVALSDGVIVKKERELLQRFARRLSISSEELENIIKNSGKHPINPPTDREERYRRFFRLIQMILVDGVIGEQQDHLVHKYAIGLGYSEERTEELYTQTITFINNKIDFDDAFKKVTQ